MITKLEIDELAQKYETIDFIKDDPVQFPHKFNKTKEDCEISGLLPLCWHMEIEKFLSKN